MSIASIAGPQQAGSFIELSTLVTVRQSDVHGQGVFARMPLRKEGFIGLYAGQFISAADANEVADSGGMTYFFALSDGSMIDGSVGGNATQFINHSCKPNVQAMEFTDAMGRPQLGIHALRDIDEGEELFLDYSLCIDGDPSDYPCHCGTSQCRGSMAHAPNPSTSRQITWPRCGSGRVKAAQWRKSKMPRKSLRPLKRARSTPLERQSHF